MEHHDSDRLWNKVFNVDSQSGTGRFVALIVVFIVIGGSISWLAG